MATQEQIDTLRAYIEQQGYQFLSISAATTLGTKELVSTIANALRDLPPIREYEPDYVPLEISEEEQQSFEVRLEDGIYYIDAPFLERILRTVNIDDYESLQYFQRVLRNTGIIARLEEMGIQEGDTVDLFGWQFDFVY